MNNLILTTTPEVKSVFTNYPDFMRVRMENLRRLVLETAKEIKEITDLEETLKWGEPSCLTKKGSTLRMDWKPKKPGQYAIYFKCTSRLVPTFKTVFGDLFTFERDRAIVFQLEDEVPQAEVKRCIGATLRYHKIKHLALLGM